MNKIMIALIVSFYASVAFSSVVDAIEVIKSDRIMNLYSEGKIVKSYRVALSISNNNMFFVNGPKRLRGDHKTPEGSYKIIKKRKNTGYPLSLKINYPNKSDIQWGKENNYSIDELGDMILIHGYPFRPNKQVLDFVGNFGISEKWIDQWLRTNFYPKFDWTDGCIAVTDDEMEEIFDLVPLGTPISIF